MALCRCLCLSYWIPLLVQDSFRQASINSADFRKLTQTPTSQLLELILFKRHMMKWQTLRSGRQLLLESGKTEVSQMSWARDHWTITLTAEHFYSPASILQHTREVLTNELCTMKAKIHLLLKESLIFILLWAETHRENHSGREPDGTRVRSKSAASIVVFSSEYPGNKIQLTIPQSNSILYTYTHT